MFGQALKRPAPLPVTMGATWHTEICETFLLLSLNTLPKKPLNTLHKEPLSFSFFEHSLMLSEFVYLSRLYLKVSLESNFLQAMFNKQECLIARLQRETLNICETISYFPCFPFYVDILGLA